MRRTILLLLVAVLALGGQVYAQWSVRKPARSEGQTLRVAEHMRSASSALGQYTLPPLVHSAAELRSLAEERASAFRTLIYATPRPLPEEAMGAGQWLESEAGDFVWRLSLTSPEARGVAVRLEQYHLPEGAALYAYGSEGGRIGALTSRNNSPDGVLQLAPLSGETLTLEYELPRGERPRWGQRPPFVITGLEHDFVGVRALSALRRGVAKRGEPFFDAILSLESMNCAPNVLAVPERRAQARSVVVLAVGGSMSSGALINTPRADGRAYILTAAHNVNLLYDVRDLEVIRAMVRGAVIFFGFESPSVEGNIRGTEEMSLSGAELVAYDPETDMAVLEITTGLPRTSSGERLPIPREYNAYFSGWSLSPTPSAPYFGIHHPGILTKRYSEAEDESLSVVDFAAASRGVYWQMKHWHLKRWAVGSTASGSSGSPLFDSQGRIIGALTAGYSYCPSTRTGRAPEDDYYYAIHRAWQGATPFASLGSILDPDGTGAQTCSGYDPNAAEPLYRLSDFYGADRGRKLAIIAPETEGAGRLVAIDGSASALGAYLVFKGNEAVDRQFPALVVELSPYDPKTKTLGAPLWREEVDVARYALYRPALGSAGEADYAHGSFDTDTRSLSRDTIELFVPVPQALALTLPRGEYLIGVRSKSGGALGLPLLQEHLRATAADANAWHYAAGQWQDSQTRGAAQLWLDLLVASSVPQTAKPQPGLDTERGEPLMYYHDGSLKVRLGAGQRMASLSVFSEDGKLVHTQSLAEGETIVSLSLPASAVYVTHIKYSGGERVLKFIAR